MREIYNSRDEKIELVLKSAYGKCKEHFVLEPDSTQYLPLYNPTQKLIDKKNKRELFVYDGDEALDIEYCFKKYDFKLLYALEIDYYLRHRKFIKHTTYKQKEKIKDFAELLFLNFEKNIIIPPFYDELEMQLIDGF